jgi:hypothetical protein
MESQLDANNVTDTPNPKPETRNPKPETRNPKERAQTSAKMMHAQLNSEIKSLQNMFQKL